MIMLFLLATEITAGKGGKAVPERGFECENKTLFFFVFLLIQPTGLRNPELERNGLYPPYTGLPGSRHSCIYPGQYNPSFISDETRRRDYF